MMESFALTNCNSVLFDVKLPTLDAKFCCAVAVGPVALLTTAVFTSMVACSVGVALGC